MTFDLLEMKNLQSEGVWLVPSDSYDFSSMSEKVNIAGEGLDIDAGDFRKYQLHGAKYIPMLLSPGIERRDIGLLELLNKKMGKAFREVGEARSQKRNFDYLAAIDGGLAEAFADYVIVEGNLTIIRFKGRSRAFGNERSRKVSNSILYLTLPEEGTLAYDEKSFDLDGSTVEVMEMDHIIRNTQSYRGPLEVSDLGGFNLHRKSLNFESEIIRSNGLNAVLKMNLEEALA